MADGNPQSAAELLFRVLKEGRARPAFEEAVRVRLGAGSRHDLAERLRSSVTGPGRAFAESAASHLTLSEPERAAEQLSRLLYDQAAKGITEVRAYPVLSALVETLGAYPVPSAPEETSGGEPGRPGPENESAGNPAQGPAPLSDAMRQSEQRLRDPAPPGTRTSAPTESDHRPKRPASSEVTGGRADRSEVKRQDRPAGFVPLEGPVLSRREEGDLISVPLFPVTPSGRPPGPVRVPAALPPPPATRDGDRIRAWLRGEPATPDAIGVSAGLMFVGEPGDLMELEAEFQSDPVTALRIYKARNPVSDGTSDAAWCGRLGRDIGRFSVTHERGVMVLAQALATLLEGQGADRVAPLRAAGANLTLREELAEAVCGLIDAELDYLSDGPKQVDGPPQNLAGSFSPNASLAEGRCLERALLLHLTASVPFGTAMRQSLTEFRIAQALRENPNAPFQTLNDRYERDPALPLEELSGRVPIVRIGYTEPTL